MYVELDIPEITEFSVGFPGYWLKSIFMQTPSERYQINALTTTYVRLVEAALVEYQSGALRLKEFWGSHSALNLGAMHRSMAHFEACISNLHRAVNCFRRLRRDREQDPLSVYLNAEKPAFAAEAVASRLRRMRNEVHHLEEMVLDGRIADGQRFALGPDGPEIPHLSEPNQTVKTVDRLVIGTSEITFSELSHWLKEMCVYATKITDYLPNSSFPNSGGSNA